MLSAPRFLPLLCLLAPVSEADGGISSVQTIDDSQGGLGPVLLDNSHFGASVTKVADMDGDGIEDLVVGAPGHPSGGALFLLSMNADGTARDTKAVFGDNLPGSLSAIGTDVCEIGDFDNNGVPDLLVGADGEVWIVLLDEDRAVDSALFFDDALAFGSTGTWGRAVTRVGDLDGNGAQDIAIGDPDGQSVWVLLLRPSGTVISAQQITDGIGGFSAAGLIAFGSAVACIPDLDGDGNDELAVADESTDGGQGAIHVLFLSDAGTVRSSTRIDAADPGLFPVGTNTPLGLGLSLSPGVDLDHNGAGDLAVGSGAEELLVLYLNRDGTLRTSIAYDTPTLGLDENAGFSASATFLGDLDGNGSPEIATGSPLADAQGTDHGAVHVLFVEGTVAASALPYGCNTNAVGSFETSAVPILGGKATFRIDNPLGTQTPGSTFPYLLVSLDGIGDPCGFLVPGFHMDPNEPFGEFLLLPPFELVLTGPTWFGPGQPVEVEVPILYDVSLLGRRFYAQGLMFDMSPGAPKPFALTQAKELLVGT